MKNPISCYGSTLLILAGICLASPRAQAQSPNPGDGQEKGAAINSTPGTGYISNPADQLGNMGQVKDGQQAAIDKMFVKKGIQGNLAEIELGQLTLQKSSNEQVKHFAQKMIDDHTKLNEQMTQLAQMMHADVPTEASKKDKGLISKMQGLSGAAYDQAYIKDMVKDHKEDLNSFNLEVSNGSGPGVKNFALQGSKTIQGHLEMAEQLAKDQNVDLAKK